MLSIRTLRCRSRILCARILIALIFAFIVAGVRESGADDAPPAAAGFRALLDRHQRESLRSIADYVSKNSDADDAEQAALWMFETALSQGLEAEVVDSAEQFLKRRGLDQPAVALAQQALCVGLARMGKRNDALALFDAHLKGIRFQSPFRTLDLASSLSAQARIAGDLAGSREIYERVAAAFPLNAQFNEIIAGRIARQELIGRPVPRVAGNDVEGKRFEMAEYFGKVVLVDFWATTCGPCLAEFPNLRQIYKENHAKGFEIVGISFDDGPETVQSYVARAKLPWRTVMDESSEGVVSKGFSVQTIPALFLVDRQGTVAQVDVRGNDLRIAVEKLLVP